MAVLDYASILQAGQNLVPDMQEQMFRQQELKQRQTMLEQQQQQRAMQMQQAALKQQREGEFRARLAGVIDSNDPRAIAKLMMEYPEFADSIKPGYDAISNEARTRNLTQLGSAYQLATGGDYKGAAGVLRKRYDADLAAGQADETTKELLDALESDDPVLQRRAASTLGMVIASQDPAKFTEAFKALNPAENKTPLQRNEEYLRQTGRGDLADTYVTNEVDPLIQIQTSKGIQIIPRSMALGGGMAGGIAPQSKGGDPAVAGGGVPVPANGSAIERTALSAVPGVTVTSRKRSPAKNAAVGGQPDSFHLTDQARDFVPPKGMSMAALAAKLKNTMPGYDVINEGDHVHVEPASRGGKQPPQVITKTISGKTYYQINGRWFDNPEGR